MSECPRIEAEMPRVGDAAAGMARRPDCQDQAEARYALPRVPPGGGASMDRPERSAIPRERLGGGSMRVR
jgi:hypothetical protein